MSVTLSNTIHTWTAPDSLKEKTVKLPWSVRRVVNIALNILLFIPRVVINSIVSLMVVPSQVMTTKIFRLIDFLGIIRDAYCPNHLKLLEQCKNRKYNSFDIEQVHLTTTREQHLSGTLFRSKIRSNREGSQDNIPTVICFTPNSRPHTNWALFYNDPLDIIQKASDHYGLAVNVFMIDYPGVGLSEGYADAKTLQEAALTADAYVHQALNVDRDRIHYYGWSLGSFVAANLATKHPEDTGLLILDKGGTSIVKAPSETLKQLENKLSDIRWIGWILAVIPRIAHWILKKLTDSSDWKNAFNTVDNIGKTKRDVICLYSTKDEVFQNSANLGIELVKAQDPTNGNKVRQNITAIHIEPNLGPVHAKKVYYHGLSLTHSQGRYKDPNGTDKITPDLIGFIVAKIIEKNYPSAPSVA